MNRPIRLLAVFLFLSGVVTRAQSTNNPRAIAERQATEADYKRLLASNEILLETQAALQKRIDDLSRRLEEIESRYAKATNDFVSRDQLQKIFDKLRDDLDHQRQQDNKLILNALDEIRKIAKARPTAESTDRSRASEPSPAPPSGPVTEYVVKEGDYLFKIIAGYNDAFHAKVTLDDILRLNPGLKPDEIHIGQKIYFPKPANQ